MNVFIDNEYHRNVLKYRMDLNFRGTKLSQFSRFDSHPRKFRPAKILTSAYWAANNVHFDEQLRHNSTKWLQCLGRSEHTGVA